MSREDPDIMTKDESGRPVVRSRCFPSPAPSDEPYWSKTFIWVTKGMGRDVEFKRIDLADLPKFEADN